MQRHCWSAGSRGVKGPTSTEGAVQVAIYDFHMPAKKRPTKPAAVHPVDRAATQEAAARVLRRFRLVFNAVKTHFQQVEKQAGVGGAQLWALNVIDTHPDIGVGGLAQAMDIHQTTASNLVKSLIERQMAAAQRNGLDRRAVQLRITSAGARILRKAPGPFAGVLPEALALLDARTLSRMDRDLGALIDLLQADDRAARIPLAQL